MTEILHDGELIAAHRTLIRDAAAGMRAYASEATEGRWTVSSAGLGGFDILSDGHGQFVGRVHGENRQHVAAWDPPVARATAALLDRVVDDFDRLGGLNLQSGVGRAAAARSVTGWTEAVELARAFNRDRGPAED